MSSTSILAYEHLTFSVPVPNTRGERKKLIDDVSVYGRPGELLAIMGPSGAGKSTLLDLMAFRKSPEDGAKASLSFLLIHLNGTPIDASVMHKISNFVEQEDALLGVLTVRESVEYALRLHSPWLSRKIVRERVERVLTAVGLQSCAEQHIGTPISRGISGGQKRRVTAACAMVTYPRILLLDEITSGLDSTAAREVISAIRTLAVAEGIIVVATIHQPSMETLSLFTNVHFLSHGKTCFSGKVDDLDLFLQRFSRPVPKFVTPAEHTMNLLNDDFSQTSGSEQDRANGIVYCANEMRDFYLSSEFSRIATASFASPSTSAGGTRTGTPVPLDGINGDMSYLMKLVWNTYVLSERSAKNYSRNLLAYGVRAGMYGGMGFMLATIWIRLGDADSTINDRLSVYFYSVAFLAFMSVAGIPSFLEERAVFHRESRNGLYTALPFVLANTLVNLPFLFFCTVFFTVVCYWAIGLHNGAVPFFRFLAFLYLAIVAAESQVVVIAALIPIFVAALAISAFMNGFWMSVGGYFIKAESLPRFWYFSFHNLDYQRFSFELISKSDLDGLVFKCNNIINGSCFCAYPSSTPELCTVSGDDVLKYLKIDGTSYSKWSAIMVGIIVIYRIAYVRSLVTSNGYRSFFH
ncbi:P-loop containing nucleoside triphosphate hydrolase protein [Pluteus cervinus]|uniref:P-loop containing nucleoside triphosphate hydrolase protein n=1 Tax=Pluteus cervinus TaxID=181527 RepID=A0ACD3AMK6_9AGAR|nr:P-loop containing nucleoside triphosphate hydrolase protein [Pluteus cervinus]